MKKLFAVVLILAVALPVSAAQKKYLGWSMGYWCTWDHSYSAATIPWNAYTCVANFQCWPNADGTFRTPDDASSIQLIAEGHKRHKKVVFCMGGAGVGDAFKGACSNANRGKFISGMLAYLKRLGYDGFDTDWEENFDNTLFIAWHKDLRDSINKLKPVPLMTVAAEDWFTVTGQVHMYVDQVNDMDYSSSASSYLSNQFQVFVKLGAPKSKLGAGMGISMGNTVQHVTDMCNMVINNGYGGVIEWAITNKGNAPADMAAIAPFVQSVPVVVDFNQGGLLGIPASLVIGNNGSSGLQQISYTVPSASNGAFVDLSVYDLKGALVKTLVHGQADAGVFTVPFAQTRAPGTYIVKLSSNNSLQATKAIIAR
jgi:hypothetical protein